MEIWLKCLINNNPNIRSVAIQALECIIKVSKSARLSLETSVPSMKDNPSFSHPGLRADNMWLQYDPSLQQDEAALEAYFSKPFLVKSYQGFYSWPRKNFKMRISSQQPIILPEHVSQSIIQFFSQKTKMDAFIKFVTMEQKKEEDSFSTDKAYFYSMLFEGLGCELTTLFMPRLKVLAASPQESEQRAAAEIISGIMFGTRFHSYQFCKKLNQELTSVLRIALDNLTEETIDDWENVFTSSKVDPNRLGWMYKLLLDNLVKLRDLGAFRAASLLRLLNRAIIQNWKARSLQVIIIHGSSAHY